MGAGGTRHARFTSFVRAPGTTLGYVRSLLRGEQRRFAGHNPLGALMVLLLLVALGAQAALGLFGNDEIFNQGPLYGYVGTARSLQLTSLHRRLFYWIAGAVAVHVLAVLVHRRVAGEDLVRPMFTGRKSAASVPPGQAIEGSRSGLALVIVIAAAAVLAWVIRHAPAPASGASFN
jgi:cytochrome b